MREPLITLIWWTILAALFPWFAPLVAFGIYRVIAAWIHPFSVIILCACVASATTWTLWIIDNKLHTIFEKQKRNDPEGKSRTWKVRRRFDQTFSVVKNPSILFIWITIGSASFIPDIFLIEFWRIKMKWKPFMLGIFCGKVITFWLMVYGVTLLTYLNDLF